MITRKLSSGKEIIIIDDFFTITQAILFEGFANNCNYRLLSSVAPFMTKSNNERFFGSVLSDIDVKTLGIFEAAEFTSLSGMFNNKRIMRSWILCTTPTTKYLYHSDETNNSSLTFLYYLNNYWNPEWGGETLFCNDKGDPEIAVACKPNRVVVFPSAVYHKPSLTTGDSKPRFTFSTTFIENE